MKLFTESIIWFKEDVRYGYGGSHSLKTYLRLIEKGGIMTVTDAQLKDKYPAFWKAVEQEVLADITERAESIAHNAAFNATYALDKYLKKAEKADKLIDLLRKS